MNIWSIAKEPDRIKFSSSDKKTDVEKLLQLGVGHIFPVGAERMQLLRRLNRKSGGGSWAAYSYRALPSLAGSAVKIPEPTRTAPNPVPVVPASRKSVRCRIGMYRHEKLVHIEFFGYPISGDGSNEKWIAFWRRVEEILRMKAWSTRKYGVRGSSGKEHRIPMALFPGPERNLAERIKTALTLALLETPGAGPVDFEIVYDGD